MARCPTDKNLYGYESCRFEKDVDENFHCSICYNVLKEPRACRNNEHMFCLACITEHLKVNSHTCPECNEHLSADTLRRPRVVSNYLSELKINCDYASRGCPENVRVAELKIHVQNCGFAPVLCSNEECGMEINKQNRVHHETEVCEYRKANWRDVGQIQNVVERLEENVMILDGKVEAVKQNQQEVKKKIEDVKKEVKEVKEKVEAARRETKNEVEEVKKEVNDVKEHLSKVNKDLDEFKVMMSQVLEKLYVLDLLKNLPSPTEIMINPPKEDILVAGGDSSSGKSTEIYSWEKNGWFEMSEYNEKHIGATSFIYKDQLFVLGGECSKTMESLDLTELHLPLEWMKCSGELPYKCDDHQTVVHEHHIILIGGYIYDGGKGLSNKISELQLSSPCTMKELCQMPEPRGRHGAEIFEDKVLVLGGQSNDDNALDSVLEIDVTKNECKEMPPLPYALWGMATVCWRDKVVVLGGLREKEEVSNNVFMYDCKTGKVTALPSMLEKRYGCCAVVAGNTIVVMGGLNENIDILNSVECFTVGGSTWKYLPAMNNARCGAIADVLPFMRKYV